MSTYHLDLVNGNDANSGADWANAWLTITTGATAARIAPDDLVKVAKTPAPVSIGNATWNNLSKTVTLAAALTALIDDCESGWTAVNGSTVTHPTDSFKAGAAAFNVTKASYATATVYAQKTITEIDLSAYAAITLFVRTTVAIADGARWVVELCSDDAATVVVDEFLVPAIATASRWVPLRIVKSGGGVLGASIKAIRVRTGASAPTNSQGLRLDNINACNDFSLCSLVSKSSAEQSTSEGWYAPQSISGVTVLLDNDTETIATAGRGYSGTTETVTTYRRETAKIPMGASNANVETIQDSGTDGHPITFSGGWNTATDMQDGETFLDGQSGGCNFAVNATSWNTLTRLSFTRFNFAIRGASTGVGNVVDLGTVCSCGGSASQPISAAWALGSVDVASVNNCQAQGGGITAGTSMRVAADVSRNHIGPGVSTGNHNRVSIGKLNNNSTYGAAVTGIGSRLDADEIADNGTAGINPAAGVDNVLRIAAITQATEFAAATDYYDRRTYSVDHDGSGYDKQFTDGGTLYQEATDFDAPATGKMWTLLTSAVTRTSSYPLKLRLRGIPVVANKLVTIKAQMRKAHASNVVGRLVMPGGQIAGVAVDVVATLASATTEEELTITFTPTAAGVVVPEVWAEYVSGHAAVCIDRLTSVTQAA